ncbi:MAG: peptidoglycan editing factor PgeF [Zoogloeaceae bacterium]|jgi:YfiH family protein|nr:peptidoglycan editing factor PgeF [Zoogloeaceae bacterium]
MRAMMAEHFSDLALLQPIFPDWPAPRRVRAMQTTRAGGVSLPPYEALNLGTHVGDAPEYVQKNREILCRAASFPQKPVWLAQTHGVKALELSPGKSLSAVPPEADAAICRHALTEGGGICAVMTADCLPVLFCARDGKAVAAAHAGWRGLCAGILENTLAAMRVDVADTLVWLGPAIGPDEFEVGEEVRAAFMARMPEAAEAFSRAGSEKSQGESSSRWRADIFLLARQRLLRAGIRKSHLFGGGLCTVTDAARFFSYRRAQRRGTETGRMASLIWLE